MRLSPVAGVHAARPMAISEAEVPGCSPVQRLLIPSAGFGMDAVAAQGTASLLEQDQTQVALSA
jgi:hypothetical protein